MRGDVHGAEIREGGVWRSVAVQTAVSHALHDQSASQRRVPSSLKSALSKTMLRWESDQSRARHIHMQGERERGLATQSEMHITDLTHVSRRTLPEEHAARNMDGQPCPLKRQARGPTHGVCDSFGRKGRIDGTKPGSGDLRARISLLGSWLCGREPETVECVRLVEGASAVFPRSNRGQEGHVA
jgi:hypothetical protein